MWNTALSFSLVLVLIPLALITLVMALGRQVQSLKIFAAGFNAFALGFILFPGQNIISPWLSIILANSMFVLAHMFLSWGIRSFYNHVHPWPVRFWYYLAMYLGTIIWFTFVNPIYEVRAILISVLVILLTFEFLRPLLKGIAVLRKRVRLPITAFLVTFMLCHCLRIVLLLLNVFPGTYFMDSSPITTFTLAFTLFFSVLWAGSIMILDGAKMMEEMNRKNSELEKLAMRDELTGVFNRHSLDQTLVAEMERQDRYRQPLSMIMLDLDRFKRINDLYGHDVGDLVLTETARRVKLSIRETDFLFRWGGEEFLVLVPHSDLAQAGILAEKLRQVISESAIDPAGIITASFGVAERIPEESRDGWFKRVDQSMYRAKANGRNQVIQWSMMQAIPSDTVHIEWRSEWDSGNEEIDRDHRKIISMGNELLTLSLSNGTEQQIQEQLDRLMDHIQQHFASEEKILSATDYPDLKNHSRRHQSLISDAIILRQRFIGKEIDPTPFFYFLVDKIILDHMLTVDVGFFPYTKINGETAKTL